MASVSRESALCDFPFRRERQNSFRTSRKCEVDSSGVPSVNRNKMSVRPNWAILNRYAPHAIENIKSYSKEAIDG